MPDATGLVQEIAADGSLTDPRWRAAFTEVPRELFVPYYYAPALGGYERLWRDDPDRRGRQRWHDGVYQDVPLATRVRDGELISSSSQPSLMARMLEYLDVRDDSRVLEIGTGPGYNAGLLCHRLSDARVTTVDIDPDITEDARRHLEAAGFHPHVVTGDGALGCPEHSPYDRIIVTVGMPTIPDAWLRQCVPGGLIVTPLATGLLALHVTDATHASGRFLPTPAFFVPLRGHSQDAGLTEGTFADVPTDALREDSFHFLRALSEQWLGPNEAYTLWHNEGRPARPRYGVTIDGEDRWAWLDSPEGPHRWPIP
ncbi:methyltransferase domain-containing protein [Streptomyces sp. AJS327]|uniref:methyltransferase domain-containing protein n=1 Tax=Streptomyces sp. AJS327 TaxID=2545265 RepID=UPI0015DEDD28|nr:methyltransferase domain-containing protein [Streptomyces sp. AJS327]MBA0049797.1 methyltransferase domain-containing protein [Streptomyces sp. AJS327]